MNTTRDQPTGYRVVKNLARRFLKSELNRQSTRFTKLSLDLLFDNLCTDRGHWQGIDCH